MSARQFYSSESVEEPIEELSLVSLTCAVSVPEERASLPVGSVGTVVAVLDRGAGYIVEFTEPFAALVDLGAESIAPVPGGSRADLVAGLLARRAP